MAGKSKQSPEIIKRIIDLLRAGNTRKTSSIAAGISEDTFARWLASNADFADAVKKAEEEAVARHVAIIAKAAERSWQASAWWLERRRREDYGKAEKLDVTTNGKDIHTLSSEALDQEIERLIKLVRKAKAD